MTPIFKNTEVSLKDVGQHMQKYAKQHNITDVPRRLLISSYFGKKIGLATPLLKWYLENDLVITRIYTVVDYVPNAALKDFTVQVAEARLPGDRDPRYALTAEMCKLEGNASYGNLITNKEKHHDIIYVDESEIGRQIISPHFYDMTELPDGYYEVERTKPSINLNIPIHAGVFILNYAKLRMLEFYYDCVGKYLSREDFIYCEMDTNSAYMAIPGDSLKVLLIPNLEKKSKKTSTTGSSLHSRPKENVLLDFSKSSLKATYCTEKFASDSSPGQVKFSMKGVNKKQFKNPMPHYEHVLNTKENFRPCNQGIQAKDQSMATYKQWKNALTYFYPKRKVLEDGCSTIPLEL